jgi:hypothetical protein
MKGARHMEKDPKPLPQEPLGDDLVDYQPGESEIPLSDRAESPKHREWRTATIAEHQGTMD